MTTRVWLDFETRSEIDLKDRGLDVYSQDPSTEVLMLAWAIDDAEPTLWQPRLGPMPEQLRLLMLDEKVLKCAWNYCFERDIFAHKLGMPTKQFEWYDPSVLCAYMSLPVGLDRAAKALDVENKIKLIAMGPKGGVHKGGVKMFSSPFKSTKKMLKEGAGPTYFKDWLTHPKEWEEFCEYCLGDVRSERAVHYAAVALHSPMTDEEKRAWLLDQRMNETGVYIDQLFVTNAKKYAIDEANQLIAQMKAITGCDNPNSGKQLKEWLKPRKYPFESLDADHVEEALKLSFLDPQVRQVLELKAKLGGSAYKKLQSIQDRIGLDGRLRDQFVYHGAHTGRESGRGVQLQNLYKPDKDAAAITDELVNGILANNLDVPSIVYKYNVSMDEWNAAHPEKTKAKIDKPIELMTAVASVIRAAFCASPGNKLCVGDLSQIESRVLAAIAGCEAMITAYKNGHDLYKEFMSWLLDKPMDLIDSDERAKGKVVILGSGFGMGVDKFVEHCATFGIIMPLESDDPNEVTAEKCIYGFREKYKEIPLLWKALDNAVKNAVRYHNRIFVNGLVVDGRDTRCLKIQLPSGRYIHYLNARLVTEMGNFGKPQDSVIYTAFDMKGMVTKRLYGGLITENVVQAIARDILFSGMFEAEKMGFKLVMTVHDEIVADVPLDSLLTKDDLLKAMTICPEWGEGMGFILAAEGYQSRYYKK
jgi:DNA polymerase